MPRLTDREIPPAISGFGVRLRSARKSLGLSMGDLADELGCSKSVISLAERETRFPGLLETVRISGVLGIRLAWLVTGELPQRGSAVTIMVEDDGTGAGAAIRRKLAHEPPPSTASQGVRRGKLSHLSD